MQMKAASSLHKIGDILILFSLVIIVWNALNQIKSNQIY